MNAKTEVAARLAASREKIIAAHGKSVYRWLADRCRNAIHEVQNQTGETDPQEAALTLAQEWNLSPSSQGRLMATVTMIVATLEWNGPTEAVGAYLAPGEKGE